MSIGAVDFNFLEKSKFGIVFGFDKFCDFLIFSALLTEELIAGKGKQFKTLITKLVMHFSQQLIVGRSESSLARYIHHQDCLQALVFSKVHNLSFDIFDLEIKERFRDSVIC